MQKEVGRFFLSIFLPNKMLSVSFSPIVTCIPTPMIPDSLPPLIDYDSDFDTLLLERKAKKQKAMAKKAVAKKRVDRTRLVKSVRFAEPRVEVPVIETVRTLCEDCHADICDCANLITRYGDVSCKECGYEYKHLCGMFGKEGRWVDCWRVRVIPTCSKCSPVYVADRDAIEEAATREYKEFMELEYEKMTTRLPIVCRALLMFSSH